MIDSRFKLIQRYEIDYSDFERFVQEKYPFLKGWEFVAATECSNDSSLTFQVGKYHWQKSLNIHDQKNWDLANSTSDISNYKISANDIFTKLFQDGHIPAGEYLVNVSW